MMDSPVLVVVLTVTTYYPTCSAKRHHDQKHVALLAIAGSLSNLPSIWSNVHKMEPPGNINVE